LRFAVRFNVAAMCVQSQRDRAKALRHQRRLCGSRHAYRQVNLAPKQVLLAVREDELDRNAGGAEPHTPVDEAVRGTLTGLGCLDSGPATVQSRRRTSRVEAA
jgi:hypothetical protein